MADAEPEAEDGSEDGGGGQAPPGQGGSAARLAPLASAAAGAAVLPADRPGLCPFMRRLSRSAGSQRRRRRGKRSLARPPGYDVRALRMRHSIDGQCHFPDHAALVDEQLEAICVKVISGEMKDQERPTPPPTTLQPGTARLSLSPRGRCSVLGPRTQRPLSTGPQARFLSHLPPIRVLVQRPLPTLRPVAPKGLGATLAPLSPLAPPAATSVSSSSVSFFTSSLHSERREKLKKSLKVKTRSGRVSRPPKYKAKDYKFIKTEDLADGHLSDSDDYSELSVEEDEDQREKQVLFDSSGCSLRPKTFKCQMCEKSYIGKGGLARHLKLNPGHGHLEPEVSLCGRASRSTARGSANGGTASPVLPASALLSQEGTQSPPGGLQNSQSVEDEEASVSGPEDGRYLGPRRIAFAAAPAEASAAVRGGAAHPPGGAGPSAAGAQGAPEARARLKEFLHQCDREALVDLVLPQLAQVVTVYEFLLMKVQTGHLAKPLFPAVYKEFEELHKRVKKMCQDYLSGSGLCSQEPLEISNNKVAESLGITEFLRKQETCRECVPGRAELGATGQKRANELAEVAPAWVKRTRRDAPPQDTGRGAPAANEGLARSAPGSGPAGQRLRASADPEARSECGAPAVVWEGASGPSPGPQFGEPRMRTQGRAPALPGEKAQEHSEDWDGSGDGPGSGALCGTLMCPGGAASLLPSGPGGLERHGSRWTSRPGDGLLPEAAGLPPDGALSAACVPGTVPEPGSPPGQAGSLPTDGGQGSLARDVGHLSPGPEACADRRELESVAGAGEAVASEITTGCRESLSQGRGQIFIHSSGGFILPHPSSVVPGEEDTVTAAGAAGPARRGFL
ncbi:zinc finger protein 839 [Suricata suricatta]|uniref:zinc finger protein 839 n=1 Tax=Suricata suricatta TaxID=37032 RepID=UPI0011558C47|nr:zinc finger protein 839 [Suricata suricatta]